MNTEIIIKSIVTFFTDQYLTIIILVWGFIIEIFLWNLKKRLKSSIYSQYDDSTDPKHAEFYLEYYRKSQFLDLIRALIVWVLAIFIVATHTSGGSSFLAVAAWAVVLTFKDPILSVVAFFLVVPKFPVGSMIAIDSWKDTEIQGQVIFVRILSVGLVGRDSHGENTGKLYEIPTHRFLTDIIRKEELDLESIKKELVKIPFHPNEFAVDFPTFLKDFQVFLNSIFPLRNRSNVGNYQTFIGHRYKMDYDYVEDRYIEIILRYVGNQKKNLERKQKIITFVESHRIRYNSMENKSED